MYTKLDTESPAKKRDDAEIIRQDDCQCACNSATEDPKENDGVVIAKNLMTNRIEVDTSVGG